MSEVWKQLEFSIPEIAIKKMIIFRSGIREYQKEVIEILNKKLRMARD